MCGIEKMNKMQHFVLLSDCRAFNFNRLALEKKDDWMPIDSPLPTGERSRVIYMDKGKEYTLRQTVVYPEDEITVYVLGSADGEGLH